MDEKLLEFEANFSVLDRYGTDVTKEEFITNPAIGRDKQIKELILILLTPEKSAILIGKPGIGKTAIVEGLAYRLQHDDVPDALKGYTIVNIKTASLLGTMPSGESKVQKMIDELKQKEKMILFIDEIHMLIGATDSSSLDFANIFKEGLGRGSIKVIGATTTEEYERYILRDKAFTRRFQKVEVPEPSHDETVEIMMGTLPKFEKQTGKKMKYTPFVQKRIMNFLVDITSEFKRVYALGSRYPDVSLTLLKQAFSFTVYDDREYMDIFDIRKAIEESKNIYQDVKKKELPRFDKEFEDIILEEKGEKPIEEWRKEEEKLPEVGEDDNKEVLVESYDNKIKKKKKKQEVIGKTKKKRDRSAFSTKKDSKNLDDLLINSTIGVIENDRSGVNIPIDYKVTSELMPDGVNDLLLNNKIGSILDSGEEDFEVQTYTRDSKVNNSLLSPDSKNIIISDTANIRKKKDIDLYSLDDGSKKKKKSVPKKYKLDTEKKPEKIEIDVSKYLNRDDLTSKPKDRPKKEEPKEEKVQEEKVQEEKDLVKKEEVKEEKNVKKGDDDMYGQNYGGNIDFLMGGASGGYPGQPGPGNDPYGQGFGNNMYQQQPPQNNFMPNQPQGMDYGMGQNSFMPQGMGNDSVGGFIPPADTSSDSSRETLFGVPMYDESKEKEMKGGQTNPGMGMPGQQPMGASGGYPGMNDPYGTPPPSNNSFFGAPMYSNTSPQDPVHGPGEGDIFGQLLLPENNMKIEGGKIVDDFSGLRVPPSIGNMNNMIIGDVTSTANQPPQDMFMGGGQSQFGMPGQMPMQNSFGMPPQDPYGMPGQMAPQGQFGMPQQSQFGMPPQGQFGMPQQSQFGMPPQGQFGMPGQSQFGMPPQGQYGMPQGQFGAAPYNPYQPQGPVFNELKVENNLLKKTPSNSDEDFVNYSDLNKGKVSQNDMSKYVSQPETKPVPRVDLNLETGAGDDDLKDYEE